MCDQTREAAEANYTQYKLVLIPFFLPALFSRQKNAFLNIKRWREQ